MRMAAQTIIWWGVIAAVLPFLIGSKVDLNSNLKKRARFRTPRDLHSSSLSRETDSEILIGPHHREVTEPVRLVSSFRPIIRSRRSTVTSAKRPGCSLSTCALHELVHLLNVFNNKSKVTNAPQEKISPQGYGRRRRRSLPGYHAKLTLQAGRLRVKWRSRPTQGVRGQATPLRVA